MTDAGVEEWALGIWASSSLAPGESLVKRKGSERSRILLPCLWDTKSLLDRELNTASKFGTGGELT